MKFLSQMTEKELKTLCKSLEAEYSGNSTVTIKQSDFNNMWASIDRYAKENKRLQEQLDEAVKIVQMYQSEESNKESLAFLRKWGYKNDVDG